MIENGKRKVVRMHPAVAENFRKIKSEIDKEFGKSKKLVSELEKLKIARSKLGDREVYIDDMPGKQIPFRYQINIPLIGGSSSPVTGTFNVSFDGPFVCRRIHASVLITNAPILTYEQQGNDPLILSYEHFIGRYAPVSGSDHYLVDCDDSAPGQPGPNNAKGYARPRGAAGLGSTVGPPLDFQWEYNDSSEKSRRQDKPVSGDILSVNDDDGYMMSNEVFAAGSTVNFIVSPTKPVTIVSGTNIDTGDTQSGPIDVELQVTFDGFKILQPQDL